jgi:ABC-2 type transport system permease protein
VSRPGSVIWLARHELRLTWRDWIAMMTAGRRRRLRRIVIGLAIFAVLMHLLAFSMVARYADIGVDAGKSALVAITGSGLLSWCLMLSQALESVTRVFYSRADLDLLLSAPIASQRLFGVRVAAMALSIAIMAALLAAPFIDAIALLGGARWLAAYGVVAALALAATALAVALTVALFRIIGPKRTRIVAQIVAAAIGAGFVIGLQAAAILSYGTLSRVAFLQSAAVLDVAPEVDSILWWPARAALGDVRALAAVLAVSLMLLGAAILLYAPRFGDHAIAAAGVSQSVSRQRRKSGFRRVSAAGALRSKEWALLLRDPWLISQTLMQLLYLLPPALLLWFSYRDHGGSAALLVPVLIMAAGQLGGGLAWLAISGEDAPDLVASSPVSGARALSAKVEAVLGGIAIVFAPFALALAFTAPVEAAVAVGGIALAAASATAIQLAFRTQAKRSHFRRRQISSRIATFAEALASIGWAATGAFAAAGTWIAVIPGVLSLAILGGAWLISPSRA